MTAFVNAIDFISRLRQAGDLKVLPVGRRVAVIGGGNTAIDVATQVRLLGAEEVTIVYRRGPEHMSATWKEQDWTKKHGVRIKFWAQPRRILSWPSTGGRSMVRELECEYTQLDENGRLIGTGDTFTMMVDQVFKAVGQVLIPNLLGDAADMLEIVDHRIQVNEDRQTSLPDVFAGGDCVAGLDLTVQAVEDGKRAAIAIDRRLQPVS